MSARARQAGARGRRQAGPTPDALTNPEGRGDAVYGAIYGALRPLDQMAAQMESKWGHGRLEALVSPETATKFATVRERLNAAIDAGDAAAVANEAAIMWRGWQALDTEATRLGREPRPAGVWEIMGDDERVYRITLTDEDKAGLCAVTAEPGERATVLSVEELLRVYRIESLAVVRKALETFPGAKIGDVRAAGSKGDEPGPLFTGEPELGPLIDDEIPF